jgi:hypothetical protein
VHLVPAFAIFAPPSVLLDNDHGYRGSLRCGAWPKISVRRRGVNDLHQRGDQFKIAIAQPKAIMRGPEKSDPTSWAPDNQRDARQR